MQFDEATLRPTYRLIKGIPGRSGALEIAESLGLPPAILEEARRRRGRSGEMIGDYLVRLREMSEDLARRLAAVDEERGRLEHDRSAIESRGREREEEQRRAAAKAVEEALQALRAEGGRYLASLRDREVQVRMRREEEKAAVALCAEARRQIRQVAGPAAPASRGPEFRVGDRVRLEGTDHRGAVQALQGDRVVVEVRGKRPGRAPPAPGGRRGAGQAARQGAPPSVDLGAT
jgi:DNA mismatch repair protein MutS2